MLNNNKRGYLQGVVYLILAQTMVAINIVSSKVLLSTIPILVLLAIRFVLAAGILLPLHWLTPAKSISIPQHFAQLERKDWLSILAQALSAGILFNILMLLGLHYTDANAAGIITSALPAIIAIMSWIVLGEKISGAKGICVLIATAGLVIIACDKLTGLAFNHSFLGDLIVLLSLLPEASYYIISKLYPVRLPIFLLSSLLNGLNALLLIVIIPFYSFNFTSISLSYWAILLILGLSSGLFYVFWYFGCQRVDGIMTSLSTAVMPVATVILAGVILGDELTKGQLVGMLLVIISVVIYARK